MVNGRNKGASYERKMAQELFLQLGIGFKRDLEQYRSGAHADLIADNEYFPFTLELKRYRDGPIGGSPSWWKPWYSMHADRSLWTFATQQR